MFFTLSKVLWAVIEPGNLLLIVLVLGCVLTLTRRRRLGQALVTLAILGFLTVAILPVGRVAIQALENRMPAPKTLPEQVAGVVVLGGMIDQYISRDRDQPAVGGAAQRLIQFAELARRYPDAKLVFTGGSGRLGEQTVKESDEVKPFLAWLGMDTERIIFEGDSRNTYENAEFSRRAVQPAPGESWILITSAFHMPRAIGSFRKVGWSMIPYPVSYLTRGTEALELTFNVTGGLTSAGTAFHEWLGLTFYYLTGRTSALHPAPESDKLGE